MKKSLLLPALLAFSFCIAQNVKLEISDYHKVMDGKAYATYQVANASYSYSRATVVFITSKSMLLELSQKIPKYLGMNQEYTDVWILGIEGFTKETISETDKKIIDTFFSGIIKYRNDNDLPPYTRERLQEDKIFLVDSKDICRYIRCGK